MFLNFFFSFFLKYFNYSLTCNGGKATPVTDTVLPTGLIKGYVTSLYPDWTGVLGSQEREAFLQALVRRCCVGNQSDIVLYQSSQV